MFTIPFELFGLFISVSLFLVVIGLATKPKTPVLILISGAFVFSQVAVIDELTLGQLVETETVTSVPVSTDYMNQQTGSSVAPMRNSSTIFVGEKVVSHSSALFDKAINKIQVRLDRSGQPTGFLYVGVWSDNVRPTVASANFIVGQLDASKLEGATNDYIFTRNDTKTYTLRANDIVGVYYEGFTTAGNTVDITYANSQVFDSSTSGRFSFSDSTDLWSSFASSEDLRGRITLVENTELDTVAYQDNIFPFTDMPKVLYALYGATLMLIGLLVLIKEQ